MKSLFIWGISAILLLWNGIAAAQGLDFGESRWIWTAPEGAERVGQFDAGARYFRATLSIPESPTVVKAECIVSCDNLYVLHLNGRVVGESAVGADAWRYARRFDLTQQLTPGQAVFAIAGYNTLPGAAGLLLTLQLTLENGEQIVLRSDGRWKCSASFIQNWEQPNFDDQGWANAVELAAYGAAPWHGVEISPDVVPADSPVGLVQAAMSDAASAVASNTVALQDAGAGFAWPARIVYVGDDCSLYRPAKNTGDSAMDSLSVTIFNPQNSRSYPEHDLPGPMKVGRKLMVLQPGATGATSEVLYDAGQGALGSPSVSYDGEWIYFSMVQEGESFFNLYRIAADGGKPERLTEGPFFDIDPAELPDGRIVFVSTRVGTFEEYHSPPARGLYVMNQDGSNLHPITSTIIFDNEPEIMADGRILFIRSDNFFDRGKVETLLHAIMPDGTSGYTEFGIDNGPEYGNRLRAYYCGSPAPMADGRVAFLSNTGITLGRPGYPQQHLQHISLDTGDVAALPDGRLLCTLSNRAKGSDVRYSRIAVVEPDAAPVRVTTLYEDDRIPLHSPVYLGPRKRPPLRPDLVKKITADAPQATGILFCQDARFTNNTTAGWGQVRAIRVLAGKGLTTRSSHSYIVHQGNETVELGTVPLAPDGSFLIEVPADTPLALQAVDGEGRSELNEMSWIYVRPGERRSCVGCHQPRQSAPISQMDRAMALSSPPLKLLGQGNPHRYRGNNAAVTGLMELQFDRFREVAGLNRYEQSHDAVIQSAIRILEGDDGEEKISAAQRLAIFRDPAAATALVACLDDVEREVQVAAAVALAACGTRESVPALVAQLSDDDFLVSEAAAMALENLTGHYEAGTHAVRAAGWENWLAHNSWEAIEEDLILRMSSTDKDVVRKAAVAMGHVGSLRSRKALRKYLIQEKKNNPYPKWMRRGNKGDNARFNAESEVNPRTLQAVTRAIGSIADVSAVDMLADILEEHSHPRKGNLFLAEAAVEALGKLQTSDAEEALIQAFDKLDPYPDYTLWYGDHPALMSCHASPIHYFILQALDARPEVQVGDIVPDIIASVPIDPDRGLFLFNDDYEHIAGRLLRRQDGGKKVIETCLAILGDPEAKSDARIAAALGNVIRCWAGEPGPEIRAAQILSMTCRDAAYAPRIEAALMQYCTGDSGIARVFNTGIPVVDALPTENWVSFYLARTLGYLQSPTSGAVLARILKASPAEAATGRPDPLGPGVLFLHNGLTPCWRAAVAWALGELGTKDATLTLVAIVKDFENATDTRHAAAVALGKIADAPTREDLFGLATSYPEQSVRLALLAAAQVDEEAP